MVTWTEAILADLAGLNTEVNPVLAAAGLPELVDWFQGEPIPFRHDNTPYGWFHFRPTRAVGAEHQKRQVGSQAALLLAVVFGAPDGAALLDQVAGTLPRMAAVLETRTWPCNVEVGGWDLALQDDDIHLDIYAMPVNLTWWRERGAIA